MTVQTAHVMKHQWKKRKNDIYRSSRWAGGSWDTIKTRRTLLKTESDVFNLLNLNLYVPRFDLLCLLFLLQFQGIRWALVVPKIIAST